MKKLKYLFDNNQKWATELKESNPEFFSELSYKQKPKYLWIGCSDSRVPASTIIGKQPGEVFVHRNIANLVIHTDLNALSVIQYAVDVLEVEHIIVCGHYGCGGIRAALDNKEHGLIDNWLRNIKDIYRFYKDEIDALNSDEEKEKAMCELNVIEQVANICHTTIVQNAWNNGKELSVHGWIYDLHDGFLKDLDLCISNKSEIANIHQFKSLKSR